MNAWSGRTISHGGSSPRGSRIGRPRSPTPSSPRRAASATICGPPCSTRTGPRWPRIAGEWLDHAPGRLCVEPGTLTPRFAPGDRTSGCLLVTAVLDALDLVRDMPGRVRECADPDCPVIYLDTSRNRSRRWCSMEVCGARAKASTYYRRHRAG